LIRNCPNIQRYRDATEERKSDDGVAAGRGNQFNATYVTSRDYGDNEVILVNLNNVMLGRFDVLLDNQATAGLFRERELLMNIREEDLPITVQGVGGSMTVTEVGDTEHFGKVAFSPTAIAKILSFDDVASMYKIEWNQRERAFYVYIGNGTVFKFVRKGGLHICNMSKYRTTSGTENVFMETVTDNLQSYTKRQVGDAERAKELIRKLGYPSIQSLVKLIKAGGILNCPVTIHDVYRAHSIWGPDIASLKGKTKSSASRVVTVEHVPKPVDEEQSLHIDIMFVEGAAYLVSVSTPLGLTLANHLGQMRGSRATQPVMDAIRRQVSL